MLRRHPRPLLSLFLRCPSPPSSIPFHFATLAAAKPTSPSSLPIMSSSPLTKLSKKARRKFPESILKHQLDICSKTNDLARAISLYDDACAKDAARTNNSSMVSLQSRKHEVAFRTTSPDLEGQKVIKLRHHKDFITIFSSCA
ncbi:hypothetical protein AKJ16_DCAP04008 [Drosera capensis]